MIIQSVLNIWDQVYDSNRKTVYTTLEDPKTHKKVIEVEQYLYDNTAKVQPANVKGSNVDVQV
jgi:hypothetical protein